MDLHMSKIFSTFAAAKVLTYDSIRQIERIAHPDARE